MVQRVQSDHEQCPGHRLNATALSYGTDIIRSVCAIAGSPSFLADTRLAARRSGLAAAVTNRDTPALFDWLASAASYQGISDEVAQGFMDRHGSAHWEGLSKALTSKPSCPKPNSYWTFQGCGYRKGSNCCSEPKHIENCALPKLPLRNGSLQQLAYSLFLFMRDVARGDFVGWIDARLLDVELDAPGRIQRLGQALIEPLRNIHGLSDKVLGMVLSDLLLGAGRGRSIWLDAGGGLIAIDTLVHNFFERTGILRRARAQHLYGPHCYRPGGCADVIRSISANLDARQFNRGFPKDFPRFVQKAIWTYCAGQGLNICNGNKIDDLKRCKQADCRLFGKCGRVVLGAA